MSYSDFITSVHNLYERYLNTWELAYRSFVGSEEYKQGRYLKMFAQDRQTDSEVINTYAIDEFGNTVGKSKARVQNNYYQSIRDAYAGNDDDGSYYQEKINNVSFYNYVKLIVNEYSSILFKNPPHRLLPESPEMIKFKENCDGHGNSLNEFFSMVDTYVSVFGVSWLSVIKPEGSDVPRFAIHKPLDVTNWEFGYDQNGDQVLKKLLIKIAEDENQTVFRYMTPNTIETVFYSEDEEYEPPFIEGVNMIEEGEGVYRIIQENELGYIPAFPIYQGIPTFPGVGSSPILDASLIQREVYNLNSDLYSSVNYGIHPTLIIDNETDELNNGEIGAEPGSIVRVNAGLQGETNYTYEFRQPDTSSITEIRDIINSKIEKMLETCMIRSDELIRASTSAAMVETLDTKLQAFIRKKAVQMENAELKAFSIWMDWLNVQYPAEISYNRQYNNRALEHELNELQKMMDLYDRFYQHKEDYKEFESEEYETQAQAEARAAELGGSGFHSHVEEDGRTIYMPFETHDEYEMRLEALNPGVDYEEDGVREDLRDRLRNRLEQLLSQSTTTNSL